MVVVCIKIFGINLIKLMLRFQIAERNAGGFLHYFAQKPRQRKLSLAGHARAFAKQNLPAIAGISQAGSYADLRFTICQLQ